MHLIRSYFQLLLLICLYAVFPVRPALADNNEIIIYIRDDVYHDYIEFVADRDILTINDFSGKHIRRDVVDMIIAQKALVLGGFKHKYKYVPGKVNFRNTKMLQTGKLLISFDSYWLADAQKSAENFYISDAVVRNGEYIAGIYTCPQNTKVLNIKTLDDLSELTAVSTPKWHTDWQTLEQLPLKKLFREDEWLSMARMVNMQWVDFLLMPFHSSEDKSFSMEKVHLVPVENIGIILKDSRHFVISKKHPMGSKAIVAINKGLQQLRANKAIEKAYTEAGFFIDRNKITVLNK